MKALKPKISVLRYGLKDLDSNVRLRVDTTSPVPWWRHIQDIENEEAGNFDIYFGAETNVNPKNRKTTIFDDGFFMGRFVAPTTRLFKSI
jgi:hypothetical protein